MDFFAFVYAFLACVLGGISVALTSSWAHRVIAHRNYRRQIAKVRRGSEGQLHIEEWPAWRQFIEYLSKGRWSTVCRASLKLQERLGTLLGLRPKTSTFKSDLLSQSELSTVRGTSTLGAVALSLWLGTSLTHHFVWGFLSASAVFIFLPYGEGRFLDMRRKQQRLRFEREVPQMLSMIALTVQAGASFDNALKAYASRFQGLLAQRSQRALELYSSKVCSRNDALDQLSKEVDSELFYRFISTVKRALYLGSPLSVAVESQLHDIRAFREEKIREEIAKKPVQILIPLGIFILPGMLILLLGPILMEVMRGIHLG